MTAAECFRLCTVQELPSASLQSAGIFQLIQHIVTFRIFLYIVSDSVYRQIF